MTRPRLFKQLVLCLLIYPAILPAQDTTPRFQSYPLNQLAENIAHEPAPLRIDLARVALIELAAVYAEEADLARNEERNRKSGLARWSAEVQLLADQYAALAETITLSTPIDITNGPEGSLYMHIDGILVVVSSPRMNKQTAFEQQVVTHFCALNRCDDWLNAPVNTTSVTTRETHASTLWSFSQKGGPICISRDGLEFMFHNTDDLGQKREACARVVAELSTLATAIEAELATGARVDWLRLKVHSRVDGNEQVILNGTGHYLRLPLPALAQRPALINRVRPWLAARVKGTPYTLVITNAGQLLTPGPPNMRLHKTVKTPGKYY